MAPGVRFIDFEILVTGVFFFEFQLSDRKVAVPLIFGHQCSVGPNSLTHEQVGGP
jgi:hypothetical protein